MILMELLILKILKRGYFSILILNIKKKRFKEYFIIF